MFKKKIIPSLDNPLAQPEKVDFTIPGQQFSVKIKLFNRLAFRAMSPTDFRNVFAKLL